MRSFVAVLFAAAVSARKIVLKRTPEGSSDSEYITETSDAPNSPEEIKRVRDWVTGESTDMLGMSRDKQEIGVTEEKED